MQSLGYKPVLAHPERYNYFHSDFAKYESFIEKGVLLQMNINSLTGYYSIPTKRIAEEMIDKNMISFLGTDCHHTGHIDLIKKVIYEKHLHKLLESGKLLKTYSRTIFPNIRMEFLRIRVFQKNSINCLSN